MDSVVSSLSLAYLLHLQNIHTKNLKTSHIPLINIPRSDLSLRTEITHALNVTYPTSSTSEGILPALTFMDEIDLKSLIENNKNTTISITDHNRLSPSQEWLAPYITRIIDHHQNEHLYSNVLERIIEPVGSCTSLVVKLWQKNSFCTAELMNEPNLSTLFLTPILIDTVNFNITFDRTKPMDISSRNYLKSISGMTNESMNNLFEELQTAKFSLDRLSSRDLLRKDYKDVIVNGYKLGISSVTWYLQGSKGWLERDGSDQLWNDIESWTKENHLDVGALMTAYEFPLNEGGFQRFLWVWCGNNISKSQCEFILNEIEKNSTLKLTNGISGGWVKHGKFWIQKNITASRKQISPALVDILKSLPSKSKS